MSDVNDHPRDQLSSYLDDELAVEQRARIDRHLALCPACRDQLAALRQLSRAIAAEPIPAPPEGLEGKVLRRLDAAAVIPFRRRFVVPASIAATVAAVGLLAVVAWKQGGPPLVPSPDATPSRVSGSLAREKADYKKEADASGNLPAPPPVQTPVPPRADAPGTPEIPARQREAPEPKAKRDDQLLDKLAVQTAPPPSSAAGAGAKDDAAPLAAKSAVAPTRVADAAPSEMQPLGKANGPVVSCAEGTVDSQLQAVWEVADPASARRTLAALASMEAGRVELSEAAAADEVTVVIPGERFEAFTKAARAIGVDEVTGAAPPAGAACVRQRIRLVPAGPR